MVDLTHYKKVLGDLKTVEFSCKEGELNLVLWLGERSHRLVAEIEKLRSALGSAVRAIDLAEVFGPQGKTDEGLSVFDIMERARKAAYPLIIAEGD